MGGRPARCGAVIAAALALCSLPSPAHATQIAVTTTSDVVAPDGFCSLREAATSAALNSTVGGCAGGSDARDTIILAAGTYALNSGALDVGAGGPVTVAGAAAGATTISQAAEARVFSVSGADQVIQDLTVANGHPAVGMDGGAVLNTGTLTIQRCEFLNNRTADGAAGTSVTGAPTSGNGASATGSAGGSSSSGGAVYNSGTLTIAESTFSGNHTGNGGNGGDATGGPAANATFASAFAYAGGAADGGAAGDAGDGGAIASVGPLTIRRSVFAANGAGDGGAGGLATGGPGGSAPILGGSSTGGAGGGGWGGRPGRGGSGGAIFVSALGQVTVVDSTFDGNFAGGGGDAGDGVGGAGGPGADVGSGTGGSGGTGGEGGGFAYGDPGAFAYGQGGSGGAIMFAGNASEAIGSSLFVSNHAGVGGAGGSGTGGAGGPGGNAPTQGAGGVGGAGRGQDAYYGGEGGAVAAQSGELTNSTLTMNSAGAGGHGGAGVGGTGGTGSSGGTAGAAQAGNGGQGGAAGAVANIGDALSLTVVSNSAGAGGQKGATGSGGAAGSDGHAGAFSAGGTWSLADSILKLNGATPCQGVAYSSGGANVGDGNLACPADSTADPMLEPLAENGGRTRTMALAAGSAARNYVPDGSTCPPTDQRGVARPQFGGCDAGAYEAAPPSASTAAATSITASGATVNGSVSANSTVASYHFEYGTTAAYGSSTPTENVGGGNAPQPVSAGLSGLAAGTTYHYRLVASTGEGTATGADAAFTTAAAPSTGGAETDTGSGAASGDPASPVVSAAPAESRTTDEPAATAADTIAPVIGAASVARRKHPKRTTLKFKLSERARVVITLRGKYGKPVKTSLKGVTGPNSKELGGLRLKRGTYTVTIVATDAAGNRSAPKRLKFAVL